MKKELTNCIYLEDSATNVLGLNIYGTPWQPEYCGWAFNLPRGSRCLSKWNGIPEGTDILITHTPPVGYGDHCCTGVRAGCVELLKTVQQRVKPKYHIYGHIHEGKIKQSLLLHPTKHVHNAGSQWKYVRIEMHLLKHFSARCE